REDLHLRVLCIRLLVQKDRDRVVRFRNVTGDADAGIGARWNHVIASIAGDSDDETNAKTPRRQGGRSGVEMCSFSASSDFLGVLAPWRSFILLPRAQPRTAA